MEDIIQRIYNLTKKKMREAGAYNHEAYETFIDESIEYYMSKGELDDDDNLHLIKDQLLSMWELVEGTEADDEALYNFPV